jgi:hypothetical protein
MKIPEHIRLHGVQPHGSRLAQPVAPITLRHALIVNFPGDNLERLSIHLEMIAVGAKNMRRCAQPFCP